MQDKVAIYCRLSKEDGDKVTKDDNSESIQNQKLLLMEYAKKQGWIIYEIYTDDDYSGLDKERPAFNEMLHEAGLGKFNIVLCKNQSRFSRDMEVIEKYLHSQFIFWGVRFIGLVDNVDTGVKGGKKARQINSLINEWYCEDLSANVTAALNTMKRSGLYVGYLCTYGYNLDPDNKHRLIIDPTAAKVVREIFELYLKGYGIASIANILTEKQYMTPGVYKRAQGKKYSNPAESRAGYSSKYGVWSVSTIRRILREKTYLGHMVQGREKKISYKSNKVIKVPEKDWIVVKHTHESIIGEETFNKVQNRLGVKSSNFKSHGEEMPRAHIFAGKVICMDCKSTMQKRYGRNRVKYLKCALALKTKNNECTLHTLRMDVLIDEVQNCIHRIIKNYINDKKNVNNLLKLVFDKNDLLDDVEKAKVSFAESLKKREENADALTSVYIDKVKGSLTEQDFQIIKERLHAEMVQIENTISSTQEVILHLESKIRVSETNEFKFDSCIKFIDLSHDMINDFIDHIEIGEKNDNGEQVVNIHWLF